MTLDAPGTKHRILKMRYPNGYEKFGYAHKHQYDTIRFFQTHSILTEKNYNMQNIHKKFEIWNADETQIIGFCHDIIENFDVLKSKKNCIIIFIGIDANVKKN